MIGPPHRAAFRPTHQRRLTHNSPTDPPTREPPHRRGPAARRATAPQATKPQGHTAKDPLAPVKSHTKRAPRGRKPPRSRGANRPPSSSRERGFGSPRPTRRVPRRTLASQSPRGRRDSDRSIAKTRLESSSSKCWRTAARTRAYGCKKRPPQHQFYCHYQSRPACTRSSPSKSSQQAGACG